MNSQGVAPTLAQGSEGLNQTRSHRIFRVVVVMLKLAIAFGTRLVFYILHLAVDDRAFVAIEVTGEDELVSVEVWDDCRCGSGEEK